MKLRQKLPNSLPATLVAISGFIALISIPIKTLSRDAYSLLPLNPYKMAHITALVVGVALIYLASQLHRRKRNALYTTVLLLLLLVALEIDDGRNLHLGVFYLLNLGLLLKQRAQYNVRSDISSLRRNSIVAGTLIAALLIFTIVTIERIDRQEFGRDLTSGQTLQITRDAVFGKELPAYVHPTHRDRVLIFSLQVALILAGSIVFIGLFYPVRLRRGSSRRSVDRAQHIIERYSISSEDYIKLWPRDKHYYFYKDSFLPYAVANGVAVVLDGATGDPTVFDELRHSFIKECTINSWTIAVIHADENEQAEWRKQGFNAFYLGSEARVNLQDFIQNRSNDKHFRYVKNKAKKDSLTVIELPQPLSGSVLSALRSVSDNWLKTGRREYRFIMGYFNSDYLRKCRVFAVYKDEKIVAYTNLIPQFQKQAASIDHMRFVPGLPSISMHFLLFEVINELHDEGVTTLNLGLAPLSRIEENTDSLSKSVLQIVKNVGNRYYSFAGLEQFKNKFGPHWEPTYLLYSGLPSRLAKIGAAASKLTTYSYRSTTQKLAIGVAVIAGLCYASFPLSIIFNPSIGFTKVVSLLGQPGQPYSWLFNSLDIVSGLLGIGVGIYLLSSLGQRKSLLRCCAQLLIVSNLGVLLAATFTLPADTVVDDRISWSLFENTEILLHLFFSVVDSGSYVIALLLWALWSYKKFGLNKRVNFVITILLVDIIGFSIGQFDPTVGAVLQRLFILGYAIWIVWLTTDCLPAKTTAAR